MSQNWSRVEFFHDGDRYFESIIAGIQSAKFRIYIESYIFSIDPSTAPILTALQEARKRGVKVQILTDGFGSYEWNRDLQTIFNQGSIEFRVYHPMPYSKKWFKWLSWAHLFWFKKLLRNINRRNHRKVILIDDKLLWMGSLNLTAVHSTKNHGKSAWRDSGVFLAGPAIDWLTLALEFAWIEAGTKNLFKKALAFKQRKKLPLPLSEFRLNYSRKMRYQIYRDTIKRINLAQNEISIVSAYFLPKRSLLRALKKAQLRGVRVRIIIPGASDVPLVKFAATPILKWLLEQGILIFEYQKSILHAKYQIIDNWASLGSSNLNHRSLLHDLEIEAIFENSEFSDNLKNQFTLDLNNSKKLDLQLIERQPFLQRWLSYLAFKFRFLL